MGILDKEYEEFQKQRMMELSGMQTEELNIEDDLQEEVGINIFDELNIDVAMELLHQSKRELLDRVRIELADLIRTNAMQGISIFSSQAYPKHQGVNEQNPFSKLTQEDADMIIHELEDKGFKVSTNIFSRDNVVFSFNLKK